MGCNELLIIFGRSFMVTVGVMLDVKAGTLLMNVLGKIIKFKIFKTSRYPGKEPECLMIDIFD